MGIQTDYEMDYIKNGVFNSNKENGEWDQTCISKEKPKNNKKEDKKYKENNRKMEILIYGKD